MAEILKKDGKKFRFLLVDDSRFARISLSKVVEQVGGEVVGEATSGEEALRRFEELRPDIVTMDMSLPDTDGITLVRRFMGINPQTLIILISGISHEEVIEEALRAGAEHFISKPLNLNKAVEIVRWVLEESDR
ncbi:MAG TPA: response regulator [Candidatus Limnocylindrales bacterium]|nr:response regulator [Candidatus Limnocylindrales bacterium]